MGSYLMLTPSYYDYATKNKYQGYFLKWGWACIYKLCVKDEHRSIAMQLKGKENSFFVSDQEYQKPPQ